MELVFVVELVFGAAVLCNISGLVTKEEFASCGMILVDVIMGLTLMELVDVIGWHGNVLNVGG